MYITSSLLQSGLSEDVASSFSDIAYKTAWMYNLFATQVFRFQKTHGGETDFTLWVLLHTVI